MAETKCTDALLMEIMAQGLHGDQTQEHRDLVYQLYRTAQSERTAAGAEIMTLRTDLATAEAQITNLRETLRIRALVKRERGMWFRWCHRSQPQRNSSILQMPHPAQESFHRQGYSTRIHLRKWRAVFFPKGQRPFHCYQIFTRNDQMDDRGAKRKCTRDLEERISAPKRSKPDLRNPTCGACNKRSALCNGQSRCEGCHKRGWR